jgi:multiple sugar transport system substrate-binding protein
MKNGGDTMTTSRALSSGGRRRLRRTAALLVSTLSLGLGSLVATAGQASAATSTTTVKMLFWPGPEGTAMQQVVNHYNATVGKQDGIHVDQILLSRAATFSKEDTLMAAHSSELDVYFTASYIVGQQEAALQPLTGISSGPYFPSAPKSMEIGGQLYAIPLDVSNHFLYYRSDLISKLLSDPAWKTTYGQISKKLLGTALTPKPPADWNWDDFLATGAFFTQSHNPASPTKYGLAMQLENLEFNVMIWDDVLWSLGGAWTNAKGQPDIDTPAALQAMNVYRTTYVDHLTSPDSDTAEYPQTEAALSSGQAAIALQWSAGYPELTSKSQSPLVAGKIAITHVPGTTHLTHIHVLGDALNRYSTHKAQAIKWLDYLATPQAMLLYAKAGGIPSMPSVLKEVASTQPAGYYSTIIDTVEHGGFSEPTLPQTQTIYTELATDLSAGWAGLTSSKAALSKAQSDLQALIG